MNAPNGDTRTAAEMNGEPVVRNEFICAKQFFALFAKRKSGLQCVQQNQEIGFFPVASER